MRGRRGCDRRRVDDGRVDAGEELTLDAAAMVVGDGLITGDGCVACVEMGMPAWPTTRASGDGADFDWVPHAAAGNECLAATVNDRPGEVLEAEIVTGTGWTSCRREPTSRSCSPVSRECRRPA